MRDSPLRRHAPLAAIVVALFLALAVLPSALVHPDERLSATLEYAPVPPHDDDPPPPRGGNLASLSLARTATVGFSGDGGGGEGGLAGAGPGLGSGKSPRTKRCVGAPLRQTEDHEAPPCVGYFAGDNFGSTYQGVTRDEVRVVFLLDALTGSPSDSGSDEEVRYRGRMFDLGAPPAPDESSGRLRTLRRYQRYFNDRYQTYDRFVRFYAYFAKAASPETRRADAIDNFKSVGPFAIVTTGAFQGFDEEYTHEMARRGVVGFGSSAGFRPAALYRRYPGLIWSYQPTAERVAELYVAYACHKVVHHPVVDSGNPGENGRARVLGLFRTTDPARPELLRVGELVRQGIEACGGRFAAEATFPAAGYTVTPGTQHQDDTRANANMARFKQAGVTTVIWPGGSETNHGRAATRVEYFPEWVIAGDGSVEGSGVTQDQQQWAHAWAVTQDKAVPKANEKPCSQAIREADPETRFFDEGKACGKNVYEDIRQLFVGIQVAGPRLTPGKIDEGFHAIPPKPSTDPRIAACFYLAGDYSCVKDAAMQFWDAPPTGGSLGCWRMVERGRRFLPDGWPAGNVDAQARPDDGCGGAQ